MSKLLDYTRHLHLLCHHCRAFLSPLLFSAPLPYSLPFATTSESSFFSFSLLVFREKLPIPAMLQRRKLRNTLAIIDQLKTPFVPALSLPQICENFVKAAYDPRISGVYLQIEGLKCGCGEVEEIQRHILDFRKSGKFIVVYLPTFGEKEYYLACACEELYAPPSAYFQL